MKYSQQIGIIAVLALAAICFMPWVYIPSANITVTGMHSEGTNFGRPGVVAMALGGLSIVLFLSPAILAKRVNFFIGTISFAWAIKNYIVISACFAGDCPEKKAGIFLQLIAALIVMIMTFLPKITIPEEK